VAGRLGSLARAIRLFEMPKSFLVKNKKPRRVEDEILDGTKAAASEVTSPG